jgi:hypothetical protein
MIAGGTGGANTMSGALFEEVAKGKAPGIPVHKTNLRTHFEENTDKLYSLSKIFPKNTGLPTSEIPKDKMERARKFEGKYLLTKALEPDECWIDYESSTMTVFEKKFQDTDGSVDEKIQTSDFKWRQYKKIATELGLENVYYIFILGDYFKNPYYKDALDYVRSIPYCDYFFASDNLF